MKRIILILSIFVLSFFFGPTITQAASAELSITGGGDQKVDSTFSMTAALNSGGNKICAISFNITYPQDVIELSSANLGSPFSLATEQSTSAGTIHYQIGAAGCSTSNATLLSMSFKAKTVGSVSVAFSSVEILGGDDGQQVIESTRGTGTVNVSAATTATTATETNPTTSTAESTNTNSPASSTSTSGTTSKQKAPASSTAPAVSIVVKDPVLTKVDFVSEAILDNVGKKAKGIIFSGTADSSTKINILIQSTPISASVNSDASGNWTYTLNDWLEAGTHKITLSSEKDGKKSNDVNSNFVFGTASKAEIAIGTTLSGKDTPAAPTAAVSAAEKTGLFNLENFSSLTFMIIVGSLIGLLVILLIIIFIIKRRKYLKVTSDIANSMQGPREAPVDSPKKDQFKDQFIVNESELLPPEKIKLNIPQEAPTPPPTQTPSNPAPSQTSALNSNSIENRIENRSDRFNNNNPNPINKPQNPIVPPVSNIQPKNPTPDDDSDEITYDK